ncbi:MAG: amino acid ABC transporter ATP-binding protein [Treponema sp.]|jgi:polar amino acid transport system ATP-binding protein|nr:amino acid ABC transporter ATP-binding protein [Treponema sp.]
MVILEVYNAAKKFASAEVLNNINFSLNEGKVLAIIGASGSGKTTLLRCLNFLERLDEGRIIVRGETLFDSGESNKYSEQEIRQKRLHFGLVFQNFNLFPQYTAFENVVLARELTAKKLPDYKKNKKSIIEEIHREGMALLDQIGLSAKRDFYPYQLSGGQQQRVAIARALALKPDILCFDEPTSALDPELTGEVLKVIRSLAEKNTTMIIVTHEMQFAREVADTILFMDEGLVVEYGAPCDVLDKPTSERTKRFLERYSAG